jgi:endonuclease/exonuclease/phosphatase family metal-dependent hydrolase
MKKGWLFFKSLLVLANIAVMLAYISTFFIPYINTGDHWIIAFMGLGFPILFFILLAFIILWLFLKSKLWILSLIVLLLGFQQIKVAFAFNWPQKFVTQKSNDAIRILQWNLKGWDDYNPEIEDFDLSHSQRPQMMKLIKESNADIICVQEFYENMDRKKYQSNYKELQSFGYQYHVSGLDFFDKIFYTGIAIFSKYPITDSAVISFNKESNAQSIVYADIKINGKTIRVMTTHLQSVRFKPNDYESLSEIKRGKAKDLAGTKTVLSKLKEGYEERYGQASIAQRLIESSPYPVIFTGDFNDVPNSSAYFKISNNLQDAFLKKGTFIGRTFRFISPTLRIDYLLASPIFKINQFRVIHVPYSDHFPLEADIEFKK